MLRSVLLIASFAVASAASAQTQPGQTTPSITPSQTPSVTPSQTPGVLPPSQPPVVVGGPAPAIGGLSKCENMIGAEKEKCLREDAATGGRAAGAGGTSDPQRATPSGSVR
jgi:hypothetical protein